jgi:hypothetical protein
MVRRFYATALLIGCCLFVATGLLGQEPADSEAGPGQAISFPLQPSPSFFVRLDVNHATRSYREGDALSVQIASEIDCFAYVLYQQADGRTLLIYPNTSQPDNRLKARQAVSVPATDELFRWKIAAPFGRERLTLLCTRQPFSPLASEALRSGLATRLSPDKLKGVGLEIGTAPPTEWGIAEVELTTFPRSAEARNYDQRRVGLFFGVAQYQFHIESEAIGGGGLNLTTCHRDAREMADLLREVGELAEVRTYTNEQATRENLYSAVTEWLPQVTRPGDTIIFYFSGHGSKLRDDNGDEQDGSDELLIPHDYISLDILGEALRRAENGTLDPANLPRLTEAVEIARRAGSTEKAAEALARETAVSDDVFAHWLQHVDGRRVLVVLDICFAGGFSSEEKDLFAAAKSPKFDFVDGEFTRLKDLGQKDLTLLASSSTRQTSAVRAEDDLSVMTYYLIESIRNATGPLTIDQAHQQCSAGMQEYFRRYNQAATDAGRAALGAHEPLLFPASSRPLFLKP